MSRPRASRPLRPQSPPLDNSASALSPAAAPHVPPRWKRILRAMREDAPCYLLAVISAVLLRLAFPRPGLWPLAWVALAPWLLALRARSEGSRAWGIAAVFGIVFSYMNMFWLNGLIQFNPFIPVGIVALGIGLGLWLSLGGWAWAVARARWGNVGGGLAGAAAWTGVEWLRSLGPYGFPWGQLGSSQHLCIPLAQTASLVGVYGLTFLILLANSFLADALGLMLSRRQPPPGPQELQREYLRVRRMLLRAAWMRISALTIIMIVIGIWGFFRARAIEHHAEQAARADDTILTLAVLQPNVMQGDKWDSYTSPDAAYRGKLQRRITADLLADLDALAVEGKRFDLIITPESAVTSPYFNRNEPLQRELQERARDLGGPIFLGADDSRLYTRDGKPTDDLHEALDPNTGEPWRHEMFVSAWLLDGERPFDSSAVYHKVRLVPFGEWLPLFNLIPGFQEKIVQIASFTPGEGPVVFPVAARQRALAAADSTKPGNAEARPAAAEADRIFDPPQVRFASSICFESLFADLHRKMARAGADLMINITNDAWYGRSSGPFQHFQILVWRAVETRRPMVRCTNTGITALISPAGRIVERLPFYEKGILEIELPVWKDAPKTLYTLWGDTFAVVCLLIGIGTVIGARRQRRPRPAPPMAAPSAAGSGHGAAIGG